MEFVKHFVLSFDLGHVANRKKLLKLIIYEFFIRNQFFQDQIYCCFDLLSNHALVGYRDLDLVNLLNLGGGQNSFGASLTEQVHLVKLIKDIILEDF